MRKGRRKLLAAFGAILLAGLSARAAQPEPFPMVGARAVRVAVEVVWADPVGEEAGAVELDVTEGKVVEAITWPGGDRRGADVTAGQVVNLGPRRRGRVRALLGGALGASLRLQGGGQVILVPLLSLIEAPQKTPPLAPVEIVVERLPWDALMVDLGANDGTVAPGGTVPITIGYNILTPEPTEVNLRCTAELRPIRGDEPVWHEEQHELVKTNQPALSPHAWKVAAPTAEGAYVLEVQTTWEPVPGPESTSARLWRWIRRRRNASQATASTRRLTLVVVGTKPSTAPTPGAGAAEQEVESIDLARLRGYRAVASGRSPLSAPGLASWSVPEAALVEPGGRDRLRGWITRSGSEAANLAPVDASGLSWTALALKVPHPGRPHRLSVTVNGGHPEALGVALIDSHGQGQGQGQGRGRGGRPRVVLDACASGPPILAGGPAATFSWPVWPDDPDPVLVMVNRDPAAPVQLGAVSLVEVKEFPQPPPFVEPDPAARRTLGLYLADARALDRFGSDGAEADDGEGDAAGDPLALARNLTQYLLSCGASSVVLPERLADRARRRSLDGQAGEDSFGPDRLDLMLRILGRAGCSAWVELATEGTLPGLPDPGTAEAMARGLIRLDREGRADGPAYHPLHPEVRDALKARVARAIAPRRNRPGLAGVLIRLGPGPTLLGGPDTGFDDATYARFVRESFDPDRARDVPGLGTSDPGRFAARSKFLDGSGRMPWLTWRSRGITALYAALARAVRDESPGALLAVATPGLEDDPAGHEARRVDLAMLNRKLAWCAVGLDLETWPDGDGAPVVLRGAGLSTDALAHDLATSPELDELVAARPSRGLLLGLAQEAESDDAVPGNPGGPGNTGLRLTALPLPEGPDGDEPLGHAMAALDARWVLLAGSAISGQEERVRRFARIFRALPSSGASPVLDRHPFGVAVRTIPLGDQTYFALANDTPYPIRLDTLVNAPATAAVEDLGRGKLLKPEANPEGRHLVLDLLPFGVAALRISAPRVKVVSVTPYPTEAVKAMMLARWNELSEQLSRLNRNPAAGRTAPPNPGFEPADARPAPRAGPSVPVGWQVATANPANTAEIDPSRSHGGRGSLRLTAPAPPASVVSDRFSPDVHSSLTIQAWLRSDQADARVRVWIEGESAGQPFVRRSELAIQPEWSAMAVRASEVPAAGLANARLRFELLTPGHLWVDDLSLASETLSETERVNAVRALVAALHAYRDNRYADFARLAGSRWVRLPSLVGLAGADGRGPDRNGNGPGMIRTGGTTALPPDRRLR